MQEDLESRLPGMATDWESQTGLQGNLEDRCTGVMICSFSYRKEATWTTSGWGQRNTSQEQHSGQNILSYNQVVLQPVTSHPVSVESRGKNIPQYCIQC